MKYVKHVKIFSLFSNLKTKIRQILKNILNLNLCHEKPERCLNIFGKTTPICARCLGMLIGVYIFTPIFFVYFLYESINFYHYILVPILLFPGFIDGFTQLMGVRISNNLLRLITGIFMGIGISLFANLFVFKIFNILIYSA